MMWHSGQYGRLVLAALLLLSLWGCVVLDPGLNDTTDGDFPLPPALEPQVDFWRHVYALWSRGQVAVHDDRYLGVIYQVADLPGPIQASYTQEQRDFIAGLQDDWQARLQRLSRKLAAATPLTHEEQALRDQLLAAGGPAALHDPAARVRTQRGLRERFRRGLEISGRYDAAFREIFRRYGVPEDLAYLPHVESSFQVNARSSVGAAGLWQFMRSTARHYMMVNNQLDERLDPLIAAEAAAQYLAEAHRQLGHWPLAITSYNHGVAGMKRAKQQYGDQIDVIVAEYQGRYFGFASRNFYAEFLAARHVARHAGHYFSPAIVYDAPLKQRQVRVEQHRTVAELARAHQLSELQLIEANPAWLTPIRSGRVLVPAGSRLWLPDQEQPAARHEPAVVWGIIER